MTHRIPAVRVLLSLIAASACVAGCAAAPATTPSNSTANASHAAAIAAAAVGTVPDDYRIQPGDTLTVSVWKEQELSGDALVRPDGGLSFPLVGDVAANGKSVAMLREEFTERMKHFIPNPVITVAVKTIGGNRVFVLGKVQRPGEYPFSRPVDVMQAISLAGGTTSFAALNNIVILHRENGRLRSIRFRYADVERGKGLDQNILLASGDTVVVP
jgi:polysaccharide biosynthesis/export protein